MLALLYDIHGNLIALEAVLADAERRGADRFVLGGDYTLFGAWPRETLDRLEPLPAAEWIRVNGERWTALPREAPELGLVRSAVSPCGGELGEERVRALADLPEQLVLDGTRYCHASPPSDVQSFFPEPGEGEEELLAGVSEPRLVFGHTHLAFRRLARTAAGVVELVNPGSVGMPYEEKPGAYWALLGPDVELRRTEFAAAEAPLATRTEAAEYFESLVS